MARPFPRVLETVFFDQVRNTWHSLGQHPGHQRYKYRYNGKC